MSSNIRTAAEAAAHRVEERWGSLTWLAGRGIGNAQGLTLGRVVIRRGMSNPRHSHPNCEEALYLLRGRLRHTMGDAQVVLEPGDTLVLDAGVPHNATSIGEEDAEMVVAYSSGDRGFRTEP
ncbi:MAG TPA: cupin domain-containing protein [Planctomycetota bacterium]|nr:cupin domain-containing protein [Planctomycetota bacterium]HRR81320.1 cupin domain-containing protein [Planctomycetota bacterium]HRT93396.1 cupin domain-containing protein [Planctomycetota bacterium]